MSSKIIKAFGVVIPNQLRRVLNSTLSYQYKKGLIDGELALTEKGASEMLNFLNVTQGAEFVKYMKENDKVSKEEEKEDE